MNGSLMLLASRAVRAFGLAVFAYLFIVAAGFRAHANQALLTVILGGAILALTVPLLIVAERRPRYLLWIAVGVVVLSAILRFAWAIRVPTIPMSDFQVYHENAQRFAQGIVPDVLPKNAGYSLLLSLFYRISPDPLSGRLVNAIVSTLTTGLLVLIGYRVGQPVGGVVAAFLFTILRSEINMVSVLGTEVPATAALTATIAGLLAARTRPASGRLIFTAGMLFGAGLTMRSPLIFYLPALLLLLVPGGQPLLYRTLALRALSFAGGIALVFSALAAWHSLSIGKPSLSAFTTQDSFPYLSGTNVRYEGGYNPEDAALYTSWPAEERNRRARKVAFDRITSAPGDFVRLVPVKIEHLIADNTYGNRWSISYINWNVWSKHSDISEADFQASNGLYAQAVYLVLLALTAQAFTGRPARLLPMLALGFVVCMLVPHAILEVQPRYHHAIVPLIALSAGSGAVTFLQRARVTGAAPTSVALPPRPITSPLDRQHSHGKPARRGQRRPRRDPSA